MALPSAFAQSIHVVGSLKAKPDYAIQLADIAAASSLLEHRLVVAFAAITETPYAIAAKAIHSMSNAHGRVKAIKQMAQDFSPSEEFRWELNELLNEIRELGGRRAVYVHGYWVVRGDGEVSLVNHALGDHSPNYRQPVDVNDMIQLAADIRDADNRLANLILPLLPPPALPESMSQRRKRPRRNPPKKNTV